jgi:hypothetical protein
MENNVGSLQNIQDAEVSAPTTPMLKDGTLALLSRLPHLTHINLAGLAHFKQPAIDAFLSSKNKSQLEVLDVSVSASYEHSRTVAYPIRTILSSCKSLRQLGLIRTNMANDIEFAAIGKQEITDIASTYPSLEVLRMSDVTVADRMPSRDDYDPASSPGVMNAIASLGIKTLDIDMDSHFDETLKSFAIGKIAETLTSLSIGPENPRSFPPERKLAAFSMLPSFKNLTHLAGHFSDAILSFIFQNCPSLQNGTITPYSLTYYHRKFITINIILFLLLLLFFLKWM